MKATTHLVALSLVVLSTVSVAALVGCSAPTIPSDGTGDDSDNAPSATTIKKKPAATKSGDSDPSGDDPTTPPPSTPAPPSVPPTTPPTTPPPTTPPPPGGDPEACMDQCAASGVAAQYWSCSANCQDQTCDDNCWNQSCGANAQACESALDTCASSCGLPPGQ